MSSEQGHKEQEQKGNDYLWDRSSEPDPEVLKLEQLLSPLAHDERPLQLPARRRSLPWLWIVAAASLLLLTGLIAWIEAFGDEPNPLELVAEDGQSLQENEWVKTDHQRILTLRKHQKDDSPQWLGEFTIDTGSRLQVKSVRAETTQLYLAQGRLAAFVAADARERFFQTKTPATNCIDLGCKYTLEVDKAGDSVVHVTLGRVAFEDHGREVFVPKEATCRASRSHGAGTPRFLDAPPEQVTALDAFDAAHGAGPARRLALAKAVLDNTPTRALRHSLPVWHLLQDKNPEVVREAHEWLLTFAAPTPMPNSLSVLVDGKDLGRVDARLRDAWKENLVAEWDTW